MATQRSLEMLAIAADVIEEQGDDDLAVILRKRSQGPEMRVEWNVDLADVDPEDIVSLEATVWIRRVVWEIATSRSGIDFMIWDRFTTGMFTPEEVEGLENEHQREVSRKLLEEAGYEYP